MLINSKIDALLNQKSFYKTIKNKLNKILPVNQKKKLKKNQIDNNIT